MSGSYRKFYKEANILCLMWVAKFKNWHKTCLIRPLCVKYKVTDFVYLLNSWTKGKRFYYTELHILEGEEENKKKFLREFKKDKSIVKFEVEGNLVFTLNVLTGKHSQVYSYVFNSKLIYVKPVVQRIDGFEDWELACWEKKPLMEVMKIPFFDMKLISVEYIKGVNLFLPQIQPKISLKQKSALGLAIKEGYYLFPRKINLDKLAKKSKVSKQTFQENIRKAENKLIPFLTESLR